MKEDKALLQPTIYTFNLNDVPTAKYAETLDILFHDPSFKASVEKRNRLVKSSERMRQGSQQLIAVARQIQQIDSRLANTIYASIVQANIHSDVTYDFLSFNDLLKYYVDYSRGGMPERVTRLAAGLDKVTFLADMLESVITDVKADMEWIFRGEVQFKQFDATNKVLQQLRGFFNSVTHGGNDSPEAQLYMEYADSINAYLEKRLHAYTAKYRRLHPTPPHYTADEMLAALNAFFGTDKFFGPNFIKNIPSGGHYIDAFALAFNLTPAQTAKLDAAVPRSDKYLGNELKYSFDVTDAIMRSVHR